MDFEFYPLHLEFLAKEALFFPSGKASNTLRGALGLAFRALSCTPECQAQPGTRACPIRGCCLYAKIFAPATDGRSPSGLADSPRPFVFRARELDGKAFQPGQTFRFSINLFSREPEVLDLFIRACAEMGREGLGPRRGKAELRQAAAEPITLSLHPVSSAPAGIRVHFLTPTELKHNHTLAERPEFPILFNRIRDRVGTLRALYGAGPLEIDFQAIALRAAKIRMKQCETHREEATRRSSRTGQVHSLGGFTGYADYEGDFREFLPWLETARYTGVGRQAVWGKGEIATEPAKT